MPIHTKSKIINLKVRRWNDPVDIEKYLNLFKCYNQGYEHM